MRRNGPFLVAMAVIVATLAQVREAPADGEAADHAKLAAARQAFVGEWKLNAELSDDPRAKMREGRPEGGWGGGRGGPHGPGGPGGGGWGRGGGWGGGGGRPPGGMGPRGGPEASHRAMLLTADAITVTNVTPEITIVGPEGALRTLHADGKVYKDSSGAEVKTRWDEGRLLVETKGERGQVKETWSVGADPRRLTVTLRVQRPFGGDVEIARVFDAASHDHP